MIRLKLLVAACALFALALAGCGRNEPPAEKSGRAAEQKNGGLRKVVLQTDWFPQAEHGGFYQALAKGFYREAGLDVEILPGGPSAGISLKVIQGEADFGMNRSDNIMRNVANGQPLVMVAATFQHDAQAIMMRAESPVKSFADLGGRTVMANAGMAWIPLVQKKYGIKFDITANSYGITAFLGDPNLIQQCFATNEPFLLQQRGIPVRALLLADSGYDCYQVIFTRREVIRKSPEMIRAFVAASIRGWQDYITADPAPADQLILQRNPQMSQALLTFSRGELIRRSLVQGDPAKGENVGQLSLERLREEQAIMAEFKVLEKPLDLSQAVTREFLPAALR